MERKQIPQLLNQDWFPAFLKVLMNEFLTWFVTVVGAARPFVPVIERGLKSSSTKRIIVIPHPVGGGFETLAPLLDSGVPVLYPESMDAISDEKGLYVMVNGFHQLSPDEALSLLKRIASRGESIAIVEGNNDSLRQIVGMTIIVPLTILLTAPFVKPFRLSRILFSWIIPVLPITTLIDGAIALMKLYAPADLDILTNQIDVDHYVWESGKADNGRGGKIIYLLGYFRPSLPPGQVV